MPIIYIIGICIFLLAAIWRIFYYKKNGDYWRKTCLPSQNGSFLSLMLGRKTLVDFDQMIYSNYKKKSKHKIGVLWDFSQPDIYLMDCETIKNVLVKDFEYFINRRSLSTNKSDLLSDLLTSIEGQYWKNMRSTLSPIFTTGKIKRMYEIFDSVGHEFTDFLKSKDGKEIDIRKYIGKYTIGVISKVVFGISYNTFSEDTTEFEENVRQFSVPSKIRLFTFVLLMQFPKIAKMLRFKFFSTKVENYFRKVVNDSIEARKKYPNQKWNDFLELLLETRTGKIDQGEAVAEKEDSFEKDAQLNLKTKIVLSDNQILANCILFLLAGFDTTETALTWAMYELAINPDIQENLKKEIDKYSEKEGRLNYEAIMNMEYLDKIIQETLRKYPPGPRLERRCEKDYNLKTEDGLDLIIPKGTLVHVPVSSLHYDEEYWPNPKKFDPERFSKDEKEKRHPYSYLPFGHGPRNCIGMRFASIEVKVCLAHLVNEFEIVPSKGTPIPAAFKKVAMKPEKDIYLSLRARN